MKRLAAELHPGLKAISPPFKDDAPDYEGQTAAADIADFQDALAKKVIAPPDFAKAAEAHRAMRAYIDSGKQGEPLPGEFASEFADYHRGAVQYESEGNHVAEAEIIWNELLARPPAERHYRTTWALYMLGKLALDGEDYDSARVLFAKVVEAAREGFADSIGLAAAALGWEAEAQFQTDHFGEAARLFLEQLATGDMSAVGSLRNVAEAVFKEDADLAPLAADPVLQRIGTAGAVSGMSPFAIAYSPEEMRGDLAARWLAALDKANVKQVRDAERVAWTLYARADYVKAARWLARADQSQPYTMWLKAKFALRDGKVDVAAKLLAEAVRKLPSIPEPLITTDGATIFGPDQVARGDLGVVLLGRGEFLAAMKIFLNGDHISDAMYVADSVLTIEELSAFIRREFPPDSAHDERETEGQRTGDAFRILLAGRLVRSARYAEARPLFDETVQPRLDRYLALLDAAKKPGATAMEQADALWKAAHFLRRDGEQLMDYFDSATAMHRLTGRQIVGHEYPVIALKLGKPEKFVVPVAKAERERLKSNATIPVHTHCSLYVAADLGWRAAALLPDDDERTARILNTAGSWLKYKDDDAADRFFQAIERRCAKTAIGKEVIAKHWFIDLDDPDEPKEE